MANYQRKTAASEGPIQKVLYKHWNDMHDLRSMLESSAQDYSRASTYGSRDAVNVVRAAHAVDKAFAELLRQFEALDNAEKAFIKKNGDVEEFIHLSQEEAGFS